jgi:hypothetical protein
MLRCDTLRLALSQFHQREHETLRTQVTSIGATQSAVKSSSLLQMLKNCCAGPEIAGCMCY